MARSKNTKSDMKFQRVMHEFGQGKLTSHGKKVTDHRKALAIAFKEARKINPTYAMKEAGEIESGIAKKGIFSIDAIEGKTFNGYTFGEDWNGWATPYFEEKEAMEIADALKGKKVDHDTPYFEFPEEEPYLQQKIQTEDGERTVYPIGAYSWTWEISEPKAEEKNDRFPELQKIYATGTAKQLWDYWNGKERSHFLIDHADMYMEEMGKNFNLSVEKFSKMKYSELPSTIKKQIVVHHAMGIYNEGGIIKSDMKLSTAKKKIKSRIDTLKESLSGIKSEKVIKTIQVKIDKLQAEFDHRPSTKEKIKANKGKFAMDVPSEYARSMYKKLWGMHILPSIHKLNGTSSIVVNSRNNLAKAYRVYSDLRKQEKKDIPPLSKISRKL